jgi:hypothetical protein
MDFSEPSMRGAMRSPFGAKHFDDRCLSRIIQCENKKFTNH